MTIDKWEVNMTIDKIVRKLGFESEKEHAKLVASVDISTPEKMARFLVWRNNSGEKSKLLDLIKLNENIGK